LSVPVELIGRATEQRFWKDGGPQNDENDLRHLKNVKRVPQMSRKAADSVADAQNDESDLWYGQDLWIHILLRSASDENESLHNALNVVSRSVGDDFKERRNLKQVVSGKSNSELSNFQTAIVAYKEKFQTPTEATFFEKALQPQKPNTTPDNLANNVVVAEVAAPKIVQATKPQTEYKIRGRRRLQPHEIEPEVHAEVPRTQPKRGCINSGRHQTKKGKAKKRGSPF